MHFKVIYDRGIIALYKNLINIKVNTITASGKKIILDSCAINRMDLDFQEGGYIVPSSIVQEIKSPLQKESLDSAIHNGNIKVVSPRKESLEKAQKAALETGDNDSLSKPDMDVLACALEHDAVIFSDDYAIQNTAGYMDIEYEPVFHEPVEEERRYMFVCTGCGRETKAKQKECSVCGASIRRVKRDCRPL